jgi:hypothetical protein
MLSQANANFNLQQCSYDIDSSKKNCARSVFFHRLGFPYSYTIESSFGIYRGRCVNEVEMMKVGEDICQTTFGFINLLLLKKNEGKLKEMISDVRRSGLEMYNTNQGENSDSDYDEDGPQRIEFEKKVTSLLIDPQLQQREIKRLEDEKAQTQRVSKVLPNLSLLEDLSPRRERVRA